MGYEKQFLQNLIAMQSVGSAPGGRFPTAANQKRFLIFFLRKPHRRTCAAT